MTGLRLAECDLVLLQALQVALVLFAPAVVHPDVWPKLAPPPHDAAIDRQVDALLAQISLEEKVGQVIEASITAATPDDIRTYHLGSVLNGGGDWPGEIRNATARDWLAKADTFYDASVAPVNGHAGIPIIWGSDGVHGHSNVVGATLFPQSIGLGCANDPALVHRIGEITADEMAVTGLDWDFYPVVAIARDERWGRTYESYSEDPAIVAKLAEQLVDGVQSHGIIATAKHFLGDGGTENGKDQGNNTSTELELMSVDGAGYMAAIRAGVKTVMASYSSWQGEKMNGNRALLTDVLKGRFGFDGFVVSDWNALGQLPGCTNDDCPAAFNAGVDMFMSPRDWKALYRNTLDEVRSGKIPQARLDDAVRRILSVKMRAGLFREGRPSQRPLAGKLDQFGSAEHRAVARQAVRESLVLLKNDHTLPLSPKSNIVVMGDGADDIGKQSGGWTLSWQGDGNTNANFPGATSIWMGIKQAVEAAGGHAAPSVDGTWTTKPDVAIVVYGEKPYAEFLGDRPTNAFTDDAHLALLRKLKQSGVRVVSVFLSGRPMWTTPFIDSSDAFVAAWLPGSEGEGVADVLFGQSDFRGRLSFSWPSRPDRNAREAPLFKRGFGLTYAIGK